MNKDNSLDKYVDTNSSLMQRSLFTIRYSQILRSLSQDLLQRIQQGHSIAENLEETTDLTDVNSFGSARKSTLPLSIF